MSVTLPEWLGGASMGLPTLIGLCFFVGGLRQVGADPALRVAARRHGRPDPGLGADPRRHHGDGRRLHGLPALVPLRDRPRAPRRSSPGSAPLTALFAATIALAQTDIKKVLAYSTVSQLGYMFLAAGCGAYTAAMFHVVTHAFFKALLFLGAGAVILAMHHEQDMRKMGKLRKKLPTHPRW